MVRALVSHQCVLRSIPRPGVIGRLSLLLVLYSALGGFSPGFFPQKPTFPNSNSIQECTDTSERVLTPWYSVGKKITYFFKTDSIICVCPGKCVHYCVYILLGSYKATRLPIIGRV